MRLGSERNYQRVPRPAQAIQETRHACTRTTSPASSSELVRTCARAAARVRRGTPLRRRRLARFLLNRSSGQPCMTPPRSPVSICWRPRSCWSTHDCVVTLRQPRRRKPVRAERTQRRRAARSSELFDDAALLIAAIELRARATTAATPSTTCTLGVERSRAAAPVVHRDAGRDRRRAATACCSSSGTSSSS